MAGEAAGGHLGVQPRPPAHLLHRHHPQDCAGDRDRQHSAELNIYLRVEILICVRQQEDLLTLQTFNSFSRVAAAWE